MSIIERLNKPKLDWFCLLGLRAISSHPKGCIQMLVHVNLCVLCVLLPLGTVTLPSPRPPQLTDSIATSSGNKQSKKEDRHYWQWQPSSCCVSKGAAISEGLPSDRGAKIGGGFWHTGPATLRMSCLFIVAALNTDTIPQQWGPDACQKNQMFEVDIVVPWLWTSAWRSQVSLDGVSLAAVVQYV